MSPLGAMERAFVLGALRTGDDRALEALPPAERERAVTALAQQRKLPRHERAAALAALLQALGASVPAGLDRIHPSWIADVLAEEPAEVAALLLAEAPAELHRAVLATMPEARVVAIREAPAITPSADVRKWLRRRTLGRLTPMTPLAGTPDELAALLALPPSDLAEALAARARAFSGMDGGTFSIAPLDATSAAVAARALEPAFAPAPREVRRQLAQRLPVAIGVGLLRA